MSTTAIRREPGKEDILVTASKEEHDYAKNNLLVTYHCACMLNGAVCGAKLKLHEASTVKRVDQLVPRCAFFSTYNSNTFHKTDCPNSPITTKIITTLSKDPENVNIGKMLSALEKKKDREPAVLPSKDLDDESVKKGRKDEQERELYTGEEEYVFKDAASLNELYSVLVNLDLDTMLGDGRLCGNVLVNSRNYLDMRQGKIGFLGPGIVVAEKSVNKELNEKYHKYQGNFSMVLQDPYISRDGRRTYYVLSIRMSADHFRWETIEKIKNEIYKERKLWLVLANWVCIQEGKNRIYLGNITSPHLIKSLKDRGERENELRYVENKYSEGNKKRYQKF